MNTLIVGVDGRQIAKITVAGKGDTFSLEYEPGWLSSGGFPISPNIRDNNSTSETIRRFLANLLPEGDALEDLSVNTHISKSNVFGLISALGNETTGALTFRAEGSPPPQTSFRPVSADELMERIAERQAIPISIWDGKPRLSTAGVQDKLPMMIYPDGTMGLGEGNLASTHILKFGKKTTMHLVVNEYICMKLAEMLKIPVAKVDISRLGEPVLIVKRFDRRFEGDIVTRFHQIDGCQMLDLPPTYKYERPFGRNGHANLIRDGASLPLLFATNHLCRVPAAATRDMLNWTLFQLLIGNRDAHGKNISFFVSRNGIEVTPAYDQVNIDVYVPNIDGELSMAIGDNFIPEEIVAYDLAEMCEQCGLPRKIVANTLIKMAKNLTSALETLNLNKIVPGEEMDFVDLLRDKIRVNIGRYAPLAKHFPSLVV